MESNVKKNLSALTAQSSVPYHRTWAPKAPGQTSGLCPAAVRVCHVSEIPGWFRITRQSMGLQRDEHRFLPREDLILKIELFMVFRSPFT